MSVSLRGAGPWAARKETSPPRPCSMHGHAHIPRWECIITFWGTRWSPRAVGRVLNARPCRHRNPTGVPGVSRQQGTVLCELAWVNRALAAGGSPLGWLLGANWSSRQKRLLYKLKRIILCQTTIHPLLSLSEGKWRQLAGLRRGLGTGLVRWHFPSPCAVSTARNGMANPLQGIILDHHFSE